MALAWDALKQKPGRNTLYNVNLKLTATHTCLESGAINHKPATYSSLIQAHTLGAVKESESSFVSFLETNCENISTLTWGLDKKLSYALKKMIGGTPEVHSDKSLTLLTFNI